MRKKCTGKCCFASGNEDKSPGWLSKNAGGDDIKKVKKTVLVASLSAAAAIAAVAVFLLTDPRYSDGPGKNGAVIEERTDENEAHV